MDTRREQAIRRSQYIGIIIVMGNLLFGLSYFFCNVLESPAVESIVANVRNNIPNIAYISILLHPFAYALYSEGAKDESTEWHHLHANAS